MRISSLNSLLFRTPLKLLQKAAFSSLTQLEFFERASPHLGLNPGRALIGFTNLPSQRSPWVTSDPTRIDMPKEAVSKTIGPPGIDALPSAPTISEIRVDFRGQPAQSPAKLTNSLCFRAACRRFPLLSKDP
jgi:hypothetical protein